MPAAYSPLSLEAALLGDPHNWRDDRRSWKRKKRRTDGSTRISRARTPAEDRELRDRYAKVLWRDGSKGSEAQADQLYSCSRRHPCGNAGCPACLGAFQHGFVRVANRFMKRADQSDGTIFAISLIPADQMVALTHLRSLDLVNFRRRVRQRLQPAVPDCAWLLLGVDLSLNEDEQKRWQTSWCPHLYGLVQTNLSREELKANLKRLFPANPPKVRRSVKVKPFKPSRYGTSYVLKPDFKRRITYAHSEGDRSKYQPLRSRRHPELQEVLRWLDHTRMSDRLLLIRLKTVRCETGVKVVTVKKSTVSACRSSMATRTLKTAKLDAPLRGFSTERHRREMSIRVVPSTALARYQHHRAKRPVTVVTGGFRPTNRNIE